MVVSDRLEEIVRGDSEHEVARFDLDFLVAVHSAQSNPQENSLMKMLHTPQPSTSQENTTKDKNHAGANNGGATNFGDWNPASIGGYLDRSDTLEQNPVCVNPNDVTTIKTEKGVAAASPQQLVQVPAAANSGQQQQQPNTYEVVQDVTSSNFVTNPDGTVTIYTPYVQTNDPMQEFITESLLQGNGNAQAGQPVHIMEGPTSLQPSSQPWPGSYLFSMKFQRLSSQAKTKTWDFSDKLNKLFVDMNKFVFCSFTFAPNLPQGLWIRALPIYGVAGFYQEPVKRCPNHASPNDQSNQEDMFVDKMEHLIRVQHEAALYEEDPETKRLSVMVPVQPPTEGTSSFDVALKFMCLGSDVGGINRRPVKLIFTLEFGAGHVVGRQVVDLRICSCPKRDRQQEEMKMTGEQKKGHLVAASLARANSSIAVLPPPDKKRRLDNKVEDMILVPVAIKDFESVNKIAESLMVARHIDKVPEIKAQRKKLLLDNNPKTNFVSTSAKNKPKEEQK